MIFGIMAFGLIIFSIGIWYEVRSIYSNLLSTLGIIIGCILIIISTFVSFLNEKDRKVIPLNNVTITEGKNKIFVETEKQDFVLTQLSDRSILKAKKVYLVIPYNYWNFKLESKVRLEWE